MFQTLPYIILLFSKHRPSGQMLSISRFVRLSVCVSVCLCVHPSVCSLLRYRLTVFLPPLPKVGCPIFLEIRNPWWKVMERSGLRFKRFWFGSGLKSPGKKKLFFFVCWFCLTKHGGNHASRWIRDLWSKGVSQILAYLKTFLSFCVLDDFFRFSKKSGFWVLLVHPETMLTDGLETSGRRAYR